MIAVLLLIRRRIWQYALNQNKVRHIDLRNFCMSKFGTGYASPDVALPLPGVRESSLQPKHSRYRSPAFHLPTAAAPF